ncbi:hypothetical protein [Halosolutus halophilus]|uniref:hypothetical protein n=1 Tax=Halosolutus halophilus TaxID=1552990 RepID=UPI002234F09B|nr:hypothetical protein [Halosolutus halophilus]
MAEEADSPGHPPVGIILVCLLLGLYSLFWILTGMVGNGPIALLSLAVAAGVLLLAYSLYSGSRTAWWLTIIFFGGSTLWRLSLVASGEPSNLLNAVVGVMLVLYLLSKHEFYHPSQS